MVDLALPRRMIWKYVVAGPSVSIEMPVGAIVRHVEQQESAFGNGTMLWAEVDPGAAMEKRRFESFATGDSFDPSNLTYVGTFSPTMGFIFHLYEVSRP